MRERFVQKEGESVLVMLKVVLEEDWVDGNRRTTANSSPRILWCLKLKLKSRAVCS